MAVLKTTLDYFPHVNRTRPMEMILAEFKEKGYAVMYSLLEEIYTKGSGYYTEWDDDVALMFTQQSQFSVGVSVVSEIVNKMFKRGILSKELFDKYAILTSPEIQETYFEAVKRRKNVTAVKEYLLVEVAQNFQNVNIISLNDNIIVENANSKKQKKVKEKKVKESKVKRVALKLILSNGDTFPVFESDIVEFEKRYQEVDVRKEFLNMKNWLELNPAKRRSFSQTRRFVETWLRKSAEGVSENGQNRGLDKSESSCPYQGGTIV